MPNEAPLEQRNMTKYYKFHKDRSMTRRNASSCAIRLRPCTYRNTLVAWSLLVGRMPLLLALRLRPIMQERATPGPIRMDFLMKSALYLEGNTASDSAKARKDNIRLARNVAMGHQINMVEHVAKLSKRESMVISFMDDEARRPPTPTLWWQP